MKHEQLERMYDGPIPQRLLDAADELATHRKLIARAESMIRQFNEQLSVTGSSWERDRLERNRENWVEHLDRLRIEYDELVADLED